jgi:group I intron endonuclease
MGFIYCITFPSEKRYIGQTRQDIKKRLIQHKSSKDNTLISRAFKKYEQYKCEVLLECENEKLDVLEDKYISEYNTMSPNGYNMRTGGQNGYHFTDEVKVKCSKKARKQNDQLPMYLYETEYGYRCRPPGRPEKYFNYKFLDKDINFLLAKEYIEGIDILYKKYIEPHNLPKFISRVDRTKRTGYRVTYPGYEKHYTSMKLSDNEKFELALNYLNSIMEKVQRLNGSG